MVSKPRTLGTRIRHAREVRELTQVALARRLRVQQDRVSKWERDVRTPRVLTLMAIADSLDVSLDFLVRGVRENSGLP
jgi:transcriptional regulator with XRE-family HTH domain